MKIFGSLKRVVAVIIVALAVLVLGREARKIMLGGVDLRTARQIDRRIDEETLAPALLGGANLARQTGDSKEAVRLLKELQKKCPDGPSSARGLVTMADMVTREEAPAKLLPQIYEWALASRNPASAAERAGLLPYLRRMDAENGWKLHWQMLMQSADVPGDASRNALAALTDAVQQTEGDAAVEGVLVRALEAPGLQGISGRVVEALLQRTETTKGAEAALALARKLAKEHASTQGGAAAFRYACDATLRLKGDAEVLSFLKECAATPGEGPALQAARAQLAAHFIGQNDPENAVAVYCGNAALDNLLTLSPETLEKAADNVFSAANRKDVTAVGLLQALAGRASERKLYRAGGALYERAGVRLQAPALKANEKETPFAEPDAPVFWQGYIAWRSGEADKGRELYEQLLPKYEDGWQVAQMLHDMARGHMAGLRYDEAVTCAERGVKALPENAAMGDLLKEARSAFEKDKALADQVVALRKEAESAVAPAARAECCMKIAEAESERRNYQDALKGYREVWEKYPETPHAPKAMYAAAEILIDQVSDKRAAREVIENLVLAYPANEMSAKAFALIKKIEGK